MAQISATVKDNTVEVIKEIAEKEKRTFSAMVGILLSEAAAKWIVEKSKQKSKK